MTQHGPAHFSLPWPLPSFPEFFLLPTLLSVLQSSNWNPTSASSLPPLSLHVQSPELLGSGQVGPGSSSPQVSDPAICPLNLLWISSIFFMCHGMKFGTSSLSAPSQGQPVTRGCISTTSQVHLVLQWHQKSLRVLNVLCHFTPCLGGPFSVSPSFCAVK